ncbi:glucose-6-phosphate isomerase [Blautia sp. Sow4_E7]|uniref:glucose-6-phosphate isomerase n=1 Tax=Blautia sp. Sow4_E7 TaxID=3438749 RepID=UPI003F91B928
MATWKNLDTLDSFDELKELKDHVDIAAALSGEEGGKRVADYSTPMAAGLSYNYAAKEVDETVLAALAKLADEAQLIDKFQELYNGAVINTGENRMVLHHLARKQLGNPVVVDGVDKREFYVAQQKKAADFANKVHAGEITNEAGEKFTTVVQIGIGGSDLGPRALYIALENWAKANNTFKMEAKFISNVDPDDAAAVLASVDLAHSLFIVVSKSGTTLETLTNEAFVKDALTKAGLNPSRHMLAVTSETSPLAKSEDYLTAIFMDDYIGGRYSSVSGVGGAILSLAFGPEVFAQLLDGAAAEDQLATNRDLMKNPDMLDALIGIYERNVQGYPSTAVLPYSQALSRFPAHLQQCDMESNGKTVNRFGEPVNYVTGPVIFGEPGTNGQHSFYQLLHQGSDIIPLQFIGFKNSQLGVDVDIENSTSQQKLCANVAAQIVAFACGKEDENLNKNFKGKRPSSIIIGEQLTPASLGALLAHFENKIMFQGFVWNLNSFDQEGVQLGKVLAKRVLAHNTDGALKVFSDLLNI